MEKIAIFSLTTSKPQMLTAILKDGALIINEVKPFPRQHWSKSKNSSSYSSPAEKQI